LFRSPHPLHDLTEFLKLSASLNYQLSAAEVVPEKLLITITGSRSMPAPVKRTLLQALAYLDLAYRQKRRRLGPWAVLHPLRAAALLTAATDRVDLLDLLCVLLHDKLEDIKEEEHEPQQWHLLEARFRSLLGQLEPSAEWYLMERLDLLTRRGRNETYYAYVGRLFDRATETPELVRIKLADRLDNTLDMRIDSEDPLDEIDFFANLFQIMFVSTYQGFQPTLDHPPAGPLSSPRRMYELFKTVVTLSLVRQKHVLRDDDTAARLLFDSLCEASMREAQRIVMHLFAYHYPAVHKQRELLAETMDYCLRGGVVEVTAPSEPHRLDGLFVKQFDHLDRAVRQRKLQELHEDEELMIEAAVAFIVIFMSFLNDPGYFVQGVSAAGLHPPRLTNPPPASGQPS